MLFKDSNFISASFFPHQFTPLHEKFYMDWKDASFRLTSSTSIDSELQKRINSETAKWRTILRGTLDVTIFLTSRNLAFLGNLLLSFLNINLTIYIIIVIN